MHTGLRLQLAIVLVVKLMVLVIVGSFVKLVVLVIVGNSISLQRDCKRFAWCLTRVLIHLLVIGFALVRLGLESQFPRVSP